VDARIKATRARLRKVILELASEKDVSAITVAEIARAADIDRSTFYTHAGSPIELLEGILLDDLDPLRAEVEAVIDREPSSLAEVGPRLNARLVDHVERNAAIYLPHGDGPSTALHIVLGQHTRRALRQVFEHLSETSSAAARFDTDYLAGFVGQGVVGVISVWLSEEAPRDRARLEAALALVYEIWLIPAANRQDHPAAPAAERGESS
jgi:AcrR family transcriptional regulator